MPSSCFRVLAVAFAVSACSGPAADEGARAGSSTGGTANDTGTGGTTSGGSSVAGLGGSGASDGGRPDAGGAGAPPRGPTGEVVMSSFVFYPTPTVSRSFAYARFGSAAATCPSTRYGDCWVSEACTDEPAGAAPHAGLITVLSPTASFSLELPPNELGEYPSWNQTGAVFTGAESLSISAAGGAVPAFSRELTYPLLLLVTEPALPVGESIVHAPRLADLILRWDRGAPDVRFQLQSLKTTMTLSCGVPSERGTLTIPAAALARLDAGAELVLITAGTQHVQAGEFDVSLVLAGVAVTPDKMQRVSIVVD